MIPVHKILLPEYKIDTRPDFDILGKKIDELLRENYLGEKIVVRALGSQEHPGKTTEELIEVIIRSGTDRYDPNRKGDRYENIENKPIDFFALEFDITGAGEYFNFYLNHFILIPLVLCG